MAARHTTASAPDSRVARSHAFTGGAVIVWGGVGLLLYFAHAAFIPVALALLFALVLSAPVEALHARHVPRSVSALVLLVLVLTTVVGAAVLLWTPAQEWATKAPQTMAVIKQKITPVARILNHLEELRRNAANMAAQGRDNAQGHDNSPPPAAANLQSAPAMILDVGGGAIAGLLAFVIVTLFLLTGGPPMLARMTAAFVDNLKSSHVLDVIGKVREEVGRFYLTTTLINIGLGVATALAMWAWGMPSPYLWGAVAAVLNYIP
jgi:predicted PurR-regulated permease PerM